MRKTEISIGVLVTCFMLFVACGSTGIEQKHTTSNNGQDKENRESFFSGWNMKSAAGASADLEEVITGDVVIVSFFATYCTRCKQKLIDHQALYEKYTDAGLSILGVSVDEPETQSNVGSYVRSRGLTFPVVIDTESKLVNQLNPRRTLPFSVLMDRNGNVLWNHVGYAPGDDRIFESRITGALKKKHR